MAMVTSLIQYFPMCFICICLLSIKYTQMYCTQMYSCKYFVQSIEIIVCLLYSFPHLCSFLFPIFVPFPPSQSLSFQSTIKHFYSQFFLCKWGPCPGVQLWTVWKRKKTSGPTASRWWGIGTTPWSWTRFRAPPTILLSLLFFLLPLPHAHLPGLLFEYMISILQSG